VIRSRSNHQYFHPSRLRSTKYLAFLLLFLYYSAVICVAETVRRLHHNDSSHKGAALTLAYLSDKRNFKRFVVTFFQL